MAKNGINYSYLFIPIYYINKDTDIEKKISVFFYKKIEVPC